MKNGIQPINGASLQIAAVFTPFTACSYTSQRSRDLWNRSKSRGAAYTRREPLFQPVWFANQSRRKYTFPSRNQPVRGLAEAAPDFVDTGSEGP